MGFVFTLMLLFYTFKACEEHYKERYPEYIWMLFFNAVMVFVYSWIYGSYMILMSSFVFAVLYVYCKNEPDRQVSLWGIPVQSGNLPWALLVMSILTGGDPFTDLIGIAAGHSYIFLKMTLPASHGYDLLKTPKLLEEYINKIVRASQGRARVYGFGAEGVNRQEDRQGAANAGANFRAFAGRGVRLGGM